MTLRYFKISQHRTTHHELNELALKAAKLAADGGPEEYFHGFLFLGKVLAECNAGLFSQQLSRSIWSQTPYTRIYELRSCGTCAVVDVARGMEHSPLLIGSAMLADPGDDDDFYRTVDALCARARRSAR